MRTKTISPISPDRITQLKEELEDTAFCYGLIPEATFDHLPITTLANPTTPPALNLMSWGLLADSHLYNNFINISGSSLLGKSIMESGQESFYFSSNNNMLCHFFSMALSISL